ncbi:MAG TPA: AI-2E family transporter [Roseomonas sp.]|jgi:predicted PurR-regulated permease PerM
MITDTLRPARLIGIVALAGLAIACFLVIKPFVSALLWAAILAYTTWPLCRLLRDRLRLSPGWAAGVMVTVEFLLIGLPLVLAAPTGRDDIDGLRGAIERLITQGIPNFGNWASNLPLVGGYIDGLLGSVELDLSGVVGLARPYAGTLAQFALSALLSLLSGIAELLVAIVLAFFFYRDGPAIADRMEALVVRVGGADAARLIALVASVTKGVVWGLIGTAVAQGIMTALGLWIAGVPQPVLLGIVAGAISILPVGAPVVWIPATIWLFVQGSTGWGIFMGLYGALGISSVDNVIRPMMISRGADLPLLLTILGALGGVFAFGFLGLFLGPVVLAVGYTLAMEFATGRKASPDGQLRTEPADTTPG